MASTSIVPAVNQIKLHPGLLQEEVVEFCRANDILLEAYSPLGTGKVLEAKELVDLANKYSKSVAQICIRYSLQKGFLPIPKSVNEGRIYTNADVFDFNLSDEDMKIIDNMPNYVGPLKNIDEINY